MKTEHGEYFVFYFSLFAFWPYQSEIMEISKVPTLSKELGDLLLKM